MTITWSPALAPAYRSDDDEPELCGSMLYTPEGGLYLGPLVCQYDAGHPVSGGPLSRHCGGSDVFTHHWSDADAALSLVEFGPSARKTGPVCTECEFRPQTAGCRCIACCAAEIIRDNYESEDAA